MRLRHVLAVPEKSLESVLEQLPRVVDRYDGPFRAEMRVLWPARRVANRRPHDVHEREVLPRPKAAEAGSPRSAP